MHVRESAVEQELVTKLWIIPGALTAVLDARRGEIDTRLARLQLEKDAARLWVQLNYLVPAVQEAPASARP